MRRNKQQSQRVQMLIKDGSMQVDPKAQMVGSQLISDIMKGITMPVREMPTPTFVHLELNRAPVQEDGVHFETVDSIPAEWDSQFLNADAHALWDGTRLNLDSEQDDDRRRNNFLKTLACIVTSLTLIGSLAFMAYASGLETIAPGEQPANSAGAPAPTPTQPAPIIPRVGGN